MARLTSRADLSRRAKVTRGAVTLWLQKTGASACVGRMVDLDHPLVVAYLADRGDTTSDAAPPPPAPAAKSEPATPTKRRPKREKAAPQARVRRRENDEDDPTPGTVVVIDDEFDIERYSDLTLRQITTRFGTDANFSRHLDARKKIADIREKDLKNDEAEGRLIERELVRTHIFGSIEACNRRLLRDTPKTLARLLYAMARSGTGIEEAEQTARELLGSQLKLVKSATTKVLRDA